METLKNRDKKTPSRLNTRTKLDGANATQTDRKGQTTIEFLGLFRSLDALKVFYAILSRCQSPSGYFFETITKIVIDLNAAGIRTARGEAFTYSIVSNRLRELVVARLVALDDLGGGVYRFEVLAEGGGVEKLTGAKERADDDLPETITKSVEVEQVEPPNARARVDNNNILKINKQNARTRAREDFQTEEVDADASTVEESDETPKRTVDEIVSSVDLSTVEAQRIRSTLVADGWERGVNADLFDRATVAILLKLPGATLSAFRLAIRNAREAVDRYRSSAGRSGRPTMWKTWCLVVKRSFDEIGAAWTSTRVASEPPRRITPPAVVAPPIVAPATMANANPSGRSWIRELFKTDRNGRFVIA